MRSKIARQESTLEERHEQVRDLRRIHRLVLAIPVSDAVQRTCDGEGRDPRVARCDGTIVDAGLQQAAQSLIDPGFQGLDFRAHRPTEVVLVGADHAPAVLGRDRCGIAAYDRIQPLAAGVARTLRLAQHVVDALQPRAKALEQQLLLARDVVVDRRFRDAERGGDVVERRVVVAVRIEGLRRGADDGLALQVVIAPTLAPRGPW